MAIKTWASGEVLTASDLNTYAGNPGLVYITQVSVGTAVSSVTVSGCFSSTYNNYRVVMSNIDCSTGGGAAIRFRLGSTTTGYYASQLYDNANGAATGYNRDNNGASFPCGMQDTQNTASSFDVISPNNALPTAINGGGIGANYLNFFAGYLDNNTQYTAFTILTGVGTMTGGTITVYGYRLG